MTTPSDRSPQQLRTDVERTQSDLQQNVHELNERVNPQRVAQRRMTSMKQSASSVRDKVMGVPSAISDTSGNLTSGVQENARGNPLAAGAIALGVGWIIGGLLPVSAAEKQKMAQLEQKAKEQAQPMLDQLEEKTQPMVEKVNEKVAP